MLKYLSWKWFLLICLVVGTVSGAFWYRRYSYYRDINASLIASVKSNNVDGVKKALKEGADPNTIHYQCRGFMDICNTYNPVLVLAVYYKKEQVSRLLLEAGADVNLKDSAEISALETVNDPYFKIPPNIKNLVLEYAKKQGKLH